MELLYFCNDKRKTNIQLWAGDFSLKERLLELGFLKLALITPM